MEDLKDIRKQITETDNQMAELFSKRMQLVAKVAEYKRVNGLPVYDPKREQQVLANGAERIKDPELKSYYNSFLKSTMEISRRYQSSILEGVRVAYCGTEGAFAHIAACKIFPKAAKIPYTSFKKAYEAVENGVNGMYDLAVTHDLLGIEGATLGDIKTVVSHSQALSQCSSFIKEKGLKEIEYSNTALAAQYVKEQNDKSIAAVASAESARLFGLDVVARSINDDRTNTTRFAVFSPVDNRASGDSGNTYFSLLFTARNEAGSLAGALSILGRYGFNMRTLRSRPMKELLWQYYFYVEAEGDIYGEEGRKCVEEMKSCCDKIKIVGSYNNLHDQEE